MNPTRPVKVIKNGEGKDPGIRAEIETAVDPNQR